jgi:hypothetical protein
MENHMVPALLQTTSTCQSYRANVVQDRLDADRKTKLRISFRASYFTFSGIKVVCGGKQV